jgi:hypothetical protein
MGTQVVHVRNCEPYETTLQKKEPVSILENINHCCTQEINPDFINTFAQSWALLVYALIANKGKFITETVWLTVPKAYRQQYLGILLAIHDVISNNKSDLGKTDTLLHKISLKMEDRVMLSNSKS